MFKWPLVCYHNFCEVVLLENSFITDSRAISAANIILLSYTNIQKDKKIMASYVANIQLNEGTGSWELGGFKGKEPRISKRASKLCNNIFVKSFCRHTPSLNTVPRTNNPHTPLSASPDQSQIASASLAMNAHLQWLRYTNSFMVS